MSIEARITKQFRAAAQSPPFELDIDLRVADGITVLLGPSGSGKTLTLNCVAGFTRPDAGRILVNDHLYFDAESGIDSAPQMRHCGYVFQDHALFPHMTVQENLRFAAVSTRTKTRALVEHRQIKELLEAFELQDLAARLPAQLSGGQRQRAALARTLITEPRFILLDEPTRGLDVRLRHSFYQLLRHTRDRLQISMLLVTHNLDECFEVADSLCLLDRGRLLQSGQRDQVLGQPASVDAARLLGVHSLLDGEIVALDPGRNTSLTRIAGSNIVGPYFPGHLIGDRGTLCIRESEIRVCVPERNISNLALLLNVTDTTASPRGVRIEFAGGISGIVCGSEYECLRGHQRLQVNIPANAISFLAQ